MAIATGGDREPAGVDAEEGLGGQVRSAAAAEALLLEIVQRHADELLRVARRHSLCLDDAHDAYQRSLEQFLRHGRRLRRETAHRWLFTVCRREALAVRRARGELVGVADGVLDGLEALHDESPEERALTTDAVTRSAEALRALKPQEVRALWLQADGRSYAEIQAATGWTYTKVNRCLRDGRRAFLERRAALETGAACRPWAGLLAAVAGGDVGAEELAALRPHLARCGACRATLRGLHDNGAAMATVLPPGLVGVAGVEAHGLSERLDALGRWMARAQELLVGPAHERAVGAVVKAQAAVEAASAGKLAAVAASAAALAGSGGTLVAATHPVDLRAQHAGANAPGAAARPRTTSRPPRPPMSVPVLLAPGAGGRPAPAAASRDSPVAAAASAGSSGRGVRPRSTPEFTPGAAGATEFGGSPRPRSSGRRTSTARRAEPAVADGEFAAPARAPAPADEAPMGAAASARANAPGPSAVTRPSAPAVAEFGP